MDGRSLLGSKREAQRCYSEILKGLEEKEAKGEGVFVSFYGVVKEMEHSLPYQ